MDLTIHHYMDDFVMENRIDTMVLGCTHYPLIRSNIERIYPDIKLINPSEEIVSSIDSILTERDMHSGESVIKNVFYASDLSENFINMIDAIMHLSELKRNSIAMEQIIEVNRIENEGDLIFRRAMWNLFRDEKDPIELIKWKHLFEQMEESIDKCENVANILEGVVMKYA